MSQKEDIKKLWKKVQADELGDVTFFESGDEFFIFETTAFGGESTLSPDVYVPFTPSKDGKQYRSDEKEEDEGHDDVEDDGTIDDEEAQEKIKHKRRKDDEEGEDGDEEDGDEEDGDEEDEEDGDDEEDDNRRKKKKKKKKDDDDTDSDDDDTDDDDDDDSDDEWEDNNTKRNKKKKKKKTKIRVGTKIRVKATGEERIVTQVSDDGTSYVTAPVQSNTPSTPKKRGGSNISDVADINEFSKGGYINVKVGEIRALTKELKRLESDIDSLKEELKSENLSQFEKDRIEDYYLPELRQKTDFVYGKLKNSLDRYYFQSAGKGVSFDKNTYEFLKEKGFADGGSIDSLWQKIRKASGNSSDVVYLDGSSKVSIEEYKDLTPYSAQARENGNYKVSFMKKDTMVIFTNEVSERKEDRKSYEKYGGVIYIFEPITNEISKEIIQKVHSLHKYDLGGSVAMNIDEYLNQSDPIFHPTVNLKPNDYIVGHSINMPNREKLTEIYINTDDEKWSKYFKGKPYILKNDSGFLYVMDTDGNPTKKSVFHIDDLSKYADGGETIKLKDLKIFTNQNELLELETTAFEGEMSPDPAWIPTGVKVPVIDGGNKGGDDDDEIEGGDNIIHTPPKPEIRVGTKVRIKNTGQEGVVTQVNDDGTYVVTPIYENGGEMGMQLHFNAEQIEPTLSSKFEAIDEPPDFDGNPSTDDDTYTRDEIEVVREDEEDEEDDEEDEDDEDNDNPPPAPKPINRDLYLGKINRIKQYVFKTPTFAKVFFNAKLQEENDFWGGQAHMVLYNRIAKDYLRIKKSIKLQSADYLLSMTNNMFPVFDMFCQANMIDIQGSYYINPSKSIEHLFAFTDRGTIRQGNEQEAQLRLLFNQICSIDWMLTVLNNEEEANDFSFIIKEAVRRIEKFIVLDRDLYAIFSLSAFYRPELYSKNYLAIHLNFIFSYYGELNLGFSNLNNGCFSDISLGVMSRDDRANVNMEEILKKTEQLGATTNMNVYTLIREKAIGDYQVYKSENIRCNDDEKPVVSRKYFLKDIDAENKSVIKQNILDFYKFCLLLKDNNKNKKVTLDNMKILSILQKESYKDFMMRIQILITKEYGI